MAARRTVKQELEHAVEFCKEHFPHGLPQWAKELKVSSVACEHGQYPADPKIPAAETPQEADRTTTEDTEHDTEEQHEA